MGPAPQIRALSAHTPGCRLLPRVGEAGTGLGEVYVCSGRGTVCILQLPLLVQLYKPVGIVTFLKKKKNPDSKVSLIDFSPSLPPLKTTKKRNKKKYFSSRTLITTATDLNGYFCQVSESLKEGGGSSRCFTEWAAKQMNINVTVKLKLRKKGWQKGHGKVWRTIVLCSFGTWWKPWQRKDRNCNWFLTEFFWCWKKPKYLLCTVALIKKISS